MLVAFASSPSGMRAAVIATSVPVTSVPMSGVPVRGETMPKKRGTMPSRDIVSRMRD